MYRRPLYFLLFTALCLCLFVNAQVRQNGYSYKVFMTADKNYGYNILQGKKVFIHQPIKPAVTGNTGFTSIADATKVAKLVIYKLNNKLFPPSVSQHEMDSLQIK